MWIQWQRYTVQLLNLVSGLWKGPFHVFELIIASRVQTSFHFVLHQIQSSCCVMRWEGYPYGTVTNSISNFFRKILGLTRLRSFLRFHSCKICVYIYPQCPIYCRSWGDIFFKFAGKGKHQWSNLFINEPLCLWSIYWTPKPSPDVWELVQGHWMDLYE